MGMRVSLGMVTVSDQDKALDFYVNTLGFKKAGDTAFGPGMRWIEVTPPGGEVSLVLWAPTKYDPTPLTPGETRNILMDTDDLDATLSALQAKGVNITMERQHQPPAPPMFGFADPDGNSFVVTQRAGHV